MVGHASGRGLAGGQGNGHVQGLGRGHAGSHGDDDDGQFPGPGHGPAHARQASSSAATGPPASGPGSSQRKKTGGRPRSKLIAPPGQRSAITFGPGSRGARGLPIDVDSEGEAEGKRAAKRARTRAAEGLPETVTRPRASVPPEVKPEIDELEDDPAPRSVDSGLTAVGGEAQPVRPRWTVASPAPEAAAAASSTQHGSVTSASGASRTAPPDLATPPTAAPASPAASAAAAAAAASITDLPALAQSLHTAAAATHAVLASLESVSQPAPAILAAPAPGPVATARVPTPTSSRHVAVPVSASRRTVDSPLAPPARSVPPIAQPTDTPSSVQELAQHLLQQALGGPGASRAAAAGPSAPAREPARPATAAPASSTQSAPNGTVANGSLQAPATTAEPLLNDIPPLPQQPIQQAAAPAPNATAGPSRAGQTQAATHIPIQPLQVQPAASAPPPAATRKCVKCGLGFPRVPFPTAEMLPGITIVPGAETCLHCLAPAIKITREKNCARAVVSGEAGEVDGRELKAARTQDMAMRQAAEVILARMIDERAQTAAPPAQRETDESQRHTEQASQHTAQRFAQMEPGPADHVDRQVSQADGVPRGGQPVAESPVIESADQPMQTVSNAAAEQMQRRPSAEAANQSVDPTLFHGMAQPSSATAPSGEMSFLTQAQYQQPLQQQQDQQQQQFQQQLQQDHAQSQPWPQQSQQQYYPQQQQQQGSNYQPQYQHQTLSQSDLYGLQQNYLLRGGNAGLHHMAATSAQESPSQHNASRGDMGSTARQDAFQHAQREAAALRYQQQQQQHHQERQATLLYEARVQEFEAAQRQRAHEQQVRDAQAREREQHAQHKLAEYERALRYAFNTFQQADLQRQMEQQSANPSTGTPQNFNTQVDLRGSTMQDLSRPLLPQHVERFLIRQHRGDDEYIRRMLSCYQAWASDLQKRGAKLFGSSSTRNVGQLTQVQAPRPILPSAPMPADIIDLRFSPSPVVDAAQPAAGFVAPAEAAVDHGDTSVFVGNAAQTVTLTGEHQNVDQISTTSPPLANLPPLGINTRQAVAIPTGQAGSSLADPAADQLAARDDISARETADGGRVAQSEAPARTEAANDTMTMQVQGQSGTAQPAPQYTTSPPIGTLAPQALGPAHPAENQPMTSPPAPMPSAAPPEGSVSPSTSRQSGNMSPRPSIGERLDEDMFNQLCEYSLTAVNSLKRLWRADEDYEWTLTDSELAARNMALDRKVVPWISAAWRYRRAFKARAEAKLNEEQQQKSQRQAPPPPTASVESEALQRTAPRDGDQSAGLKRKASAADLNGPPATQPGTSAGHALANGNRTQASEPEPTAAARAQATGTDFQPNGLLGNGPPPEKRPRTERITSTSSVSSASDAAGPVSNPAALVPALQAAPVPLPTSNHSIGPNAVVPAAPDAAGQTAVLAQWSITPEQIVQYDNMTTHWIQSIYTDANRGDSILQADIWHAYKTYAEERQFPSVQPAKLFRLIEERLPRTSRGKALDGTFRVFGIRTRIRPQPQAIVVRPAATTEGPRAIGDPPLPPQGLTSARMAQGGPPRGQLPVRGWPPQAQAGIVCPPSAFPRSVPEPRLPGSTTPRPPTSQAGVGSIQASSAQPGFAPPASIAVIEPIKQKGPEERMRGRLNKQWDFLAKNSDPRAARPWLKALNHAGSGIPGQPVMRMATVPMTVTPNGHKAKNLRPAGAKGPVESAPVTAEGGSQQQQRQPPAVASQSATPTSGRKEFPVDADTGMCR